MPESLGVAKKLWEKIYNAELANGLSKEESAKRAWGGVEKVYHKDENGTWVKNKADLTQFSLAIKKASYDPKSGEYRWRADVSDVDPDLYNDSMSMELYANFMKRIESGEKPPEEFCSDFWAGGMPYLSLSHYPDLNGDAVPGVVDAVYIDGKFFKSKGRMNNTPLGKASWDALKKDLEHKSVVTDAYNPVRMSIAFLDYKHQHKRNDFLFERSDENPICIECLKEAIGAAERKGRTFLDGHLVHFALTRVPVNQRTIMEVDKSMTTRKEDASSIVGDELAEEIEKKSELVGKSEALVIKSDAADPVLAALNALTSVVQELKSQVVELSKAKDKKMMDQEDMQEAPEDSTPDAEDKAEGPDADMKKKHDKMMKSDTVDYTQFIEALSQAFSTAMNSQNQKLDLLITAVSQQKSATQNIPLPRSIQPGAVPQQRGSQTQLPAGPVKIADFVKRSLG